MIAREATRVALPEAELLRRLASLPEAFILGDAGRRFCGAFADEVSDALDPAPDKPLVQGGDDWPHWIGLLPYEAFRQVERSRRPEHRAQPLLSRPLWARYDAVAELSSTGVTVRGTPSATARLVRALNTSVPERAPPALTLVGQEAPALHRARIETALAHIARGDLYQVNLARRLEFRALGHPIDLLCALGRTGNAPFSAAIAIPGASIVSASPELCLHHLPSGELITQPIKGTRPRAEAPEEDERLARELDASVKERAELAMVVDIERNDLGRIAQAGSVVMRESPHVVSHPTVHHRAATVAAMVRSDVSRAELLQVMLPSGSVTGAPKVRAMDLIAELESERRGLYTGALGYLAHDGSVRLSMAIRVLSLSGAEAHYFSGGGIVADSEPEQELEETHWKAAWLNPLLVPNEH